MKMIKIALADDHKLLRNALAALINSYGDCEVIFEANTGREFCEMIRKKKPDIAILDFNMPDLNGHECSEWLKENYPDVHVLILSMYDTEMMLIKMLQAGVKGFMKKDIHPSELHKAIHSVVEEGYYYSAQTSTKLAGFFRDSSSTPIWSKIMTDQELSFMKLVCSELTYKEIAEELGLNPRTVDAIRDSLFGKLDVKSRVGLAMYAIKHGLVSI
jgi:two-component system, NarL family, invasion response regulator UvrY